jgi:hypothetical protein
MEEFEKTEYVKHFVSIGAYAPRAEMLLKTA